LTSNVRSWFDIYEHLFVSAHRAPRAAQPKDPAGDTPAALPKASTMAVAVDHHPVPQRPRRDRAGATDQHRPRHRAGTTAAQLQRPDRVRTTDPERRSEDAASAPDRWMLRRSTPAATVPHGPQHRANESAGTTPHRSRAARRSTLIGLMALALAACAVWVQAGAAGSTGSGPLAAPGAGPTRAIAARVWIVQPGDTLWGIARHLQATGDIRPLVDELSHEVHGQPLQVGQQLTLP